MPDYGAGFYLDENLDFSVNSTGDLEADRGVGELYKDLSLNIYRALAYGEGIERPVQVASGGVVGEPLVGGTLDDIEVAAGKVVNNDPRVDSLMFAIAEEADDESDYVELDVRVLVDDEVQNFEFVIPA